VDLDAELAALQAEARAKLDQKAEEERTLAPDPSLGPDPSLEAPKPEEIRTFPGLPDLSGAKAIAAGLGTAAKASEAAKEAGKTASRFTLLQKVGIAVASVVVFVVCWKLFLKTIVEAVLAVAILLLILVAIGKLLGWTKALEKKDED
jgi:hypothetical protein